MMKSKSKMLIVLICLLVGWSNEGFSKDTFEVDVGSLTQHYLDNTTYPNQLAQGLILNPLVGYKYTEEDTIVYDSYTIFMGNNSVQSGILGGIYSFGAMGESSQIGVAFGAYHQNDSSFMSAGILPPMNDINGYVLLAGFEANYRWMLGPKNFIKVNTYLFPNIINATIGFGGYL